MNAEVINLRRVKKNLARSQKEINAEANRKKFGRTKAEKTITAFELNRAAKNLDDKKRDL